MRRLAARLHISTAAVLLCCAANAQAIDAKRVAVDIPPQPILGALKQLGEQTGLQLLMSVDNVSTDGIVVQPLAGSLTLRAALDKLLANTGLTYEFINERTVRISRAQSRLTSSIEDKSRNFHLAQIARTTATDVTGVAPGNERLAASDRVAPSEAKEGSKSGHMEEVLVTAQKRSERLQEVPVPVTALSATTLAESSQLRIQDYYNKIPGLGLALISDGSEPVITIRGVTTGGFTNPTVGIVVDDVSYGATINPGTAPSAPDVDPGDLARVEVLRGPQGTLYGASSMGGLLKFVTVDPSTDRLSGRVQVGSTTVDKGNELGYNVRGAVNVPLSDSFAVRASGFKIREPGYVDNIQTGQRDVDRTDSDGGRLSALWRPSDAFSLKLSALLQDSNRRGTSDVDVTLGADNLQQRALQGTGIYGRKTQAYGATMNGMLGDVELVSATGYNIDTVHTAIDQSAAFGADANTNFGVTGVAGPFEREIDKFTQEIRATLPIGKRVTWLLGAFYTAEDIANHLVYSAANPATGAAVGTLYKSDTAAKFDEYALFTNIDVDVTERFDVQVGGRTSKNKQTFTTTRSGPLAIKFFGTSPSVVPKLDSDDNVFTYLVTPRFKVSPDLMLYARLASGYRPGGPNTGCGIPTVPCQFNPDRTQNYEIGFKGNAFDRVLSFDASLYYIDWKDIQTSLTIGGFGYQDNAGRAKSQGAEFSVEAEPLSGLKLAAWASWDDAELTEGFPAAATNVSGRPGDRLPYSSRLSGSISADQRFPLWSRASAFVGASVAYVGDRKGVFRRAGVARETFPSYTQLDLRTGMTFDTWTVNAFVNNLTDERGVLRSGLDSLRPTFLTYIQPRTVGLSLTKNF